MEEIFDQIKKFSGSVFFIFFDFIQNCFSLEFNLQIWILENLQSELILNLGPFPTNFLSFLFLKRFPASKKNSSREKYYKI